MEDHESTASLNARIIATRAGLSPEERRDMLAEVARLEAMTFLELQHACEEMDERFEILSKVDRAVAVVALDLLFERFVGALSPEARARYEKLYSGAKAGAPGARD